MTSCLRMPRAPLDPKPNAVRCDNSLNDKPTLKPCSQHPPSNSDAAGTCCAPKTHLFLVHLSILPPGWGPEITHPLCSLRPLIHSPSLVRCIRDKDCCRSQPSEENSTFLHWLRSTLWIVSLSETGACVRCTVSIKRDKYRPVEQSFGTDQRELFLSTSIVFQWMHLWYSSSSLNLAGWMCLLLEINLPSVHSSIHSSQVWGPLTAFDALLPLLGDLSFSITNGGALHFVLNSFLVCVQFTVNNAETETIWKVLKYMSTSQEKEITLLQFYDFMLQKTILKLSCLCKDLKCIKSNLKLYITHNRFQVVFNYKTNVKSKLKSCEWKTKSILVLMLAQ